MAGSHREDADLLLDHHEPAVLIDNLHVAALEAPLVTLRLAHGHLHARLQQKVELRDGLAVHLDALPL